MALDAAADPWPIQRADAVICINMIHIAPWEAAIGLVRGAAHLLPASGVLYLYGPYRRDGQHTAPSNEAFDRGLRMQNRKWGVRDLETVAELAEDHGFAQPLIERNAREQPLPHFPSSCARLGRLPLSDVGDGVEAADWDSFSIRCAALLVPKIHRRPTLQEPGGKLGVGGRYARHELEHGKRGIEGVSSRWSSGCFAAGFGSADTGSVGKQGCVSSFSTWTKAWLWSFFLSPCGSPTRKGRRGPPVIVVTRTWQVRSCAGILIILHDTGRHPCFACRNDHLSWAAVPPPSPGNILHQGPGRRPFRPQRQQNASRPSRGGSRPGTNPRQGQPMPAAGTRAI